MQSSERFLQQFIPTGEKKKTQNQQKNPTQTRGERNATLYGSMAAAPGEEGTLEL